MKIRTLIEIRELGEWRDSFCRDDLFNSDVVPVIIKKYGEHISESDEMSYRARELFANALKDDTTFKVEFDQEAVNEISDLYESYICEEKEDCVLLKTLFKSLLCFSEGKKARMIVSME